MTRKIILAGDIGGTKTLLQLAEFAPGATRPTRTLHQQRFSSADYDELESMLRAFLGSGHEPIYGACFGVAGPVEGDELRQRARLTNLPWQLDSSHLADVIGSPRVRLINDFAAIGHGIEALGNDDLHLLHDRPPRPGAPRLVVGAGTGLGVALLMPCDKHYRVYPTEGGHADFAPADELQDGLLAFLREEWGHVSWERVVSGPGLTNIYRYLLARAGAAAGEDPYLAAPDPAAAIASAGAPHARAALELFVALFGAVVGNLALTCLPYGGVYLAGGIAPKILPHLQHGALARTYCDKGRMQPLVDAMPVYVVTNPEVGLLGALLAASRL